MNDPAERPQPKTIGLLGGMSWESSGQYYRLINEAVRARRRGYHSARCLLYSLDFGEMEALQRQGLWDQAAELLIDGGQRLARGGAELLVIASTTLHKLAEKLEAALPIPLLHSADATAAAIRAAGLRRVGLLGTAYTMEQTFYTGRLTHRHGLDIVVPDLAGRELVDQVIFQELAQGRMTPKSRNAIAELLRGLAEQHQLEGVIVGSSILSLLIGPADSPVPVFDTARIHAQAAVEAAFELPPAPTEGESAEAGPAPEPSA
jgi:aspartate racemase